MHPNLKMLLMSSIMPFSISTRASVVQDLDPISISGFVEMPNLNHAIPLNLNMVDGHPFAYIDVVVKVNGKIEINEEIITKYLSTKNYSISGFKNPNESKQIEISVSYTKTNVTPSVCKFNFYAPRCGEILIENVGRREYVEQNPIRIDFSMKGSSNNIVNTNESAQFIGTSGITCQNTRYVFFDWFNFYIKNSKTDIKECEARLYTKVDNSDLIYNGEYVSFSLPVWQFSEGKYQVYDLGSFYINNKTGGVQINYTDDCDTELLKFFMPFSYGTDTTLFGELVYHNVGKNMNTYIYRFIIKIYDTVSKNSGIYGSFLQFEYREFDDYLDVDYE